MPFSSVYLPRPRRDTPAGGDGHTYRSLARCPSWQWQRSPWCGRHGDRSGRGGDGAGYKLTFLSLIATSSLNTSTCQTAKMDEYRFFFPPNAFQWCGVTLQSPFPRPAAPTVSRLPRILRFRFPPSLVPPPPPPPCECLTRSQLAVTCVSV